VYVDDELLDTLRRIQPQLADRIWAGQPPLKEALQFIIEHVQYYLHADPDVPDSLIEAEFELFQKLATGFIFAVRVGHAADISDAWAMNHAN